MFPKYCISLPNCCLKVDHISNNLASNFQQIMGDIFRIIGVKNYNFVQQIKSELILFKILNNLKEKGLHLKANNFSQDFRQCLKK